MKHAILLLYVAFLAACDFRVDLRDPPAAPGNPAGPTTVSVTNTNTAIADRSDTNPTPTPPGGTEPPTGLPLPLPAYGEQVTRSTAAANPSLLANSCQDTTGESAWAFLDLVIRTLRAQDQRWGYLCKDASCVTFGRDIVAYRATNTNLGIWIVDVIGNHCPGPNDPPPSVRWGVLPFETSRPWAASRTAGAF